MRISNLLLVCVASVALAVPCSAKEEPAPAAGNGSSLAAEASQTERAAQPQPSQLKGAPTPEPKTASGALAMSVASPQSTDSPPLAGLSAKSDVSYAGTFSYSYPIRIPAGTNGVAPSIALVYNSACQNGMLGMGFSLGGFSTIEHDPSYPVESNRYLYQGQRLYYSYPSIGIGTFHTEREGFEAIQAFSTDIARTDSPNTATSHWEVHRKDGSKLFFGKTPDSRIDAVGKGGVPRLWALNRYEDVNGNFYTIQYDEDPANGDYYPAKVIYTQGNGLAVFKAVLFSYESRTDHGPMYVPTLVDNSKRLKWITVKTGVDSNGNGGYLVRKYRLDYAISSTTQRSLLTAIQEYGNNGTTPPCPDVGAYTAGPAEQQLPADTIAWQSGGDNGSYTYNVNGDFGGLSGSVFYPGDYNGDGRTDLFAHNDSTGWNTTLISNGDRTYTYNEAGDFNGLAGCVFYPGDYNGDGKADLFASNSGNNWSVTMISNGDRTYTYEETREIRGFSGYVFYPADYDGDGRTDLFAYNPSTGIRCLMISNGDHTYRQENFTIGYPGLAFYPGDYDGDGKSDLFVHSGTRQVNQTGISNGRGFVWTSESYLRGFPGYTFNPGDYNGDGRTDLFAHNDATGSNVTLISNGDRTYQTCTDFAAFSASALYGGDYNGDGKADLFARGTTSELHATLLKSGPRPDVITVILTASQGKRSVTYAPAPQVAGAVVPSSSVYPSVANASPRLLVTQMIYDGQFQETIFTRYQYSDGRRLSGTPDVRADLGFSRTMQTNDAVASGVVTFYRQDKPFHGLVDHQYTCSWNGTSEGAKYAEQVNTYETRSVDCPGVSFVYLKSRTGKVYDGQASSLDSRTEYEYGLYGDVTKITDLRYIDANGANVNVNDDTITEVQYEASGIRYVVKPLSKTVSSYDAKGILGVASRVSYLYDGFSNPGILRGLLTGTQTSVVDGSVQINSSVEYDMLFGNPHYLYDGRGLRTELTYHSPYFAQVYEKINPKFQIERTDYDVYDRPVEVRDINNQVTTVEYDVFGRISRTILPYDDAANPTSVIEYSDALVPPPFPRYIHTSLKEAASSYLETYEYFDGLGRLVQTKREAANGQWDTVDHYYPGKSQQTSVPYFTTSWKLSLRDGSQRSTLLSLDPLGRVIQTRNPDGTYRRMVYAGNVTTFVDESSHAVQKEINTADARVSFERRFLGVYPSLGAAYSTTTTKNYRGLQQIVDTNGNTISVYLDMIGRKTQYADPDKGVWRYSYDANGNLTSQTDAKQITVVATYDELNRLTKKDYPHDTDVVYTYDEPNGHGATPIGKLTSLFYGGSESYSYDRRGRLTSVSKMLDGVTRTMSYGYDSLDRIVEQRYPDLSGGDTGETVRFAYGSDGNISSMGGLAAYVTSISYNPQGKVQSISYGNLVTTTYSYYDVPGVLDPSNGNRAGSDRLQSIRATSGGAPVLQLTYQYDPVGNVMKKIDASGYSETYAYDALDRLTTLNGSSLCTYDTIDNIRMKDNKTYWYGSPHAVVEVRTGTIFYNSVFYGYDANGNMTSWRSRSVNMYYDDAGRLVQFNDPTGGTYSYDAGTQRTIKTQGTKKTIYFFPTYEEEYSSGSLTRTMRYYEVNGLRVAQRSSMPSEGLLYIHADHLGSSTRLTNESGVVVLQLSYKPFGSLSYSSGSAATRYRFTGQELDGVLYYYNARYYDPDLARFIQADSLLDGLNRYSYCHNNPVRYTDPTGNFIFSVLLSFIPGVGTAIGAIIDAACYGALLGAAAGAATNAVSQVIGIASGAQSEFDLDSLGSAMLNGAIAGAISGAIGGAIGLAVGGASAGGTTAGSTFFSGPPTLNPQSLIFHSSGIPVQAFIGAAVFSPPAGGIAGLLTPLDSINDPSSVLPTYSPSPPEGPPPGGTTSTVGGDTFYRAPQTFWDYLLYGPELYRLSDATGLYERISFITGMPPDAVPGAGFGALDEFQRIEKLVLKNLTKAGRQEYHHWAPMANRGERYEILKYIASRLGVPFPPR